MNRATTSAFIASTAALLLASLADCGAADGAAELERIPPGAVVEGAAHLEDGVVVSDGHYRVTFPRPAGHSLRIIARAGSDPRGIDLNLMQRGSAVTAWTINTQGTTFELGTWEHGVAARTPRRRPSKTHLQLPWGLKYFFVRPNPAFYELDDQKRLVAGWKKRPGASEHFFAFTELRDVAEKLEIWIDGRLVRTAG